MSQFFGSLPQQGMWSAVGLSRTQFCVLVAASTLLFVFIGGPVWLHVHSSHLVRILLSYAIIPVFAAVALQQRSSFTVAHLIGATLLVSMVKLLLTAAILIAIALLG